MKELLGSHLRDWLINQGIAENFAIILQSAIAVVVVLILAWLSDIISRKVLITIITKLVRKTKTHWDDILLERKVFNKLSHFAPAIIINFSAGLIYHEPTGQFIQQATQIYMIILALMLIDSFLSAANDIYNTLTVSKTRPIKGYIQIVKIFFYVMGCISIIGILIDKTPTVVLGTMGAFAAVLILVFKDTILGFVASIQLSANKMVSIGDWISMPSKNADGTVIDISLNTVKVQNWDKTISTIPTYALVSESFNNWKGMEESGGRRIKRHLNIDVKSIHFLSDQEIEMAEKVKLITSYIQEKKEEIKQANPENEIPVNQKRLTNIGTFRKYIEAYLENHPKIHNDMTFLVRQLQPSEKGLPIEIYVFSNDQEWANYEAIQADIFDHILAIVPEFNLRVFQNPTGDDFNRLIQ
ncbi:mechanosensitive ion channel family protein [Ancylomarina euxinus]|uniref:Mechanosensing system component YbdG n=1 Tax=Ancylomarina euxinus TaxID=2283627 RepID=A0A425Y5P9_9BACT|nr:mechanosensitive ion channel domain-containing protein [Ancylomarina euxinus]MCZ4694207.1 mechanosensitive ion channel [Ancylomarina euxinus]MUP14462.1 mechanosensitive ion channel [Ancylomarina euxinus]RRG23765.1 mechanosensitive ion channel family protein [Ancylomarina euxinus]